MILAGRRINDDMGRYVAQSCVKRMIAAGRAVKGARVAVLGFTFKEDCPDTRNTRAIDIVDELREFGIEPVVADPAADADEARRLYGVELADMGGISGCDAVILAVAHAQLRDLPLSFLDGLYSEGARVLLDVKGTLDRASLEAAGYDYWRL